MLRAVVDPGVLIAAVIAPGGTPASILRACLDGEFDLVASPKLLAELHAVLLRPKFRPYLPEGRVAPYVELIARIAVVYEDPADVPAVTPDPGDDYLVALARTAQAHYLVSGDAHLTELRNPNPPVVNPRRFMSLLAGTAWPEDHPPPS